MSLRFNARHGLTVGTSGTQTLVNVVDSSGNITAVALSSSGNLTIGVSKFVANATTGVLTVTGQIQSSVTTGTAPLTVQSTTLVTNLNSDKLKGNDWAVPASIGSTTPNAGAFTTLSSSGAATLNSLSLTTALPITSGGTGATSAAQALANLGVDAGASIAMAIALG